MNLNNMNVECLSADFGYPGTRMKGNTLQYTRILQYILVCISKHFPLCFCLSRVCQFYVLFIHSVLHVQFTLSFDGFGSLLPLELSSKETNLFMVFSIFLMRHLLSASMSWIKHSISIVLYWSKYYTQNFGVTKNIIGHNNLPIYSKIYEENWRKP